VKKEKVRNYFLSCPESYEDFPFGEEITIFKVKNKWFGLLVEREGNLQINLKCDPDEALILRDLFKSVLPGYHMNKKHWNTVILDGSIPEKEIEAMIYSSYVLIVEKLKKKDRLSLEAKYGKQILYEE
jgi:predicted DNA-binding protein (MmcQ/YjbR family)|tara:strand:- start:523 stop:906 length:384 start_codon:yes stop_codon:yes gene_type:complete